jgi:uncharacterized protein involved in exopolysaccharide biosynthesis
VAAILYFEPGGNEVLASALPYTSRRHVVEFGVTLKRIGCELDWRQIERSYATEVSLENFHTSHSDTKQNKFLCEDQMASTDYTPLTLVDIFAAGWRQKWLAFTLFLGLTFLGIALLWLTPNQYASQAQLLVRLGPNAVAMDPTADLSQTVSLQESRLHQVNSVLELIQSREMIERVARRVGTERILEPIGAFGRLKQMAKDLLPKSEVKGEHGYTGDEIAELIQLGDACKKLKRGFSTSVGKKAYTVNVQFSSSCPYLSHDVVEALLAEYPQYHSSAHGSTGSVDFFDQELASSLTAATAAQSMVRDLKLKMGIVDLDSEKLALQEKLSDLERGANDTAIELAAVDAELSILQGELKSMPERIIAEETTGIFKRSGDLVRQGLYELELKEKELATKFNADHPKMQSIRTQLEQAKLIANSEIGQTPQVRNVSNPIRQEMELLYRQALAKQAGLKAKQKQLDVQLASAREELKELNLSGAQLARLSWDAEVAEKTYMDTAQRLANARQIADLESLKLSDVAIAQPATLQLTKTGPLRFIFGAAGAMVAAFIALFAASLKDASQLSKQPVTSGKRRTSSIEVWAKEPEKKSAEAVSASVKA